MKAYETSDDFLDGMFLLQERLEKDGHKGNKIHKRRGARFELCGSWPTPVRYEHLLDTYPWLGVLAGEVDSIGCGSPWRNKVTFLLDEEPRRVSNSKTKNKK